PSVAARPTAEALALDAADEFFQATSGSKVEALDYLDRVYSPLVTYCGNQVPKAEVLKEKAVFVERWPQRRYFLREGAAVECAPDGACIVDGLVDWHNYSPERK